MFSCCLPPFGRSSNDKLRPPKLDTSFRNLRTSGEPGGWGVGRGINRNLDRQSYSTSVHTISLLPFSVWCIPVFSKTNLTDSVLVTVVETLYVAFHLCPNFTLFKSVAGPKFVTFSELSGVAFRLAYQLLTARPTIGGILV